MMTTRPLEILLSPTRGEVGPAQIVGEQGVLSSHPCLPGVLAAGDVRRVRLSVAPSSGAREKLVESSARRLRVTGWAGVWGENYGAQQ